MRKYLLALSLPIFLASCEKQDDKENQDVEAPEIESLSINEEDHQVRIEGGKNMTLEAHIHDDEGLQEAKVEIHDVFDSHSHGKNATSKWSTLRTIPISGTEVRIQEFFLVPGQATAGRYHAIVRALDEAGNEAEFREINFVVENGQQPTFTVTDPDFSQGEVPAPKGSTFSLQGSVDEENDLVEIIIAIVPEHDDANDNHNPGNSEEPLIERDFDFPESNDRSFNLSNFSVTIPAAAEAGDYKLEITALDAEGNYGLFEAEIHIL